MTSQGILYVKEYLNDILENDMIVNFGEGAFLKPPSGWDTNIESEYPKSSDIPVVMYKRPDKLPTLDEDSSEEFPVRVGTLHVELRSEVKKNINGEEFVGRVLDSHSFTVWDVEDWELTEP
jgi:hypothetical protein